MAGRIDTRTVTQLVLAGLMAIGLGVALIGGVVAIVRIGQPDGATATVIAEASAWIFALAFLATFGLAIRDLMDAPKTEP
jgi:hypothetical protein